MFISIRALILAVLSDNISIKGLSGKIAAIMRYSSQVLGKFVDITFLRGEKRIPF